jgi:hypothetical protein
LKLEENLDVMVYTVDDKLDPLKVSSENNRHYYGRFDRSKFVGELMTTLPINGEFFMIIFDVHFILEGEWMEEHWEKPLYNDVIPGILLLAVLYIIFKKYELLFIRIVSV